MTETALERVLTALHSRAINARRAGAAWRFPCPAHNGEGNNAYAIARPGEVKVGCHSRGCPDDDILDALGLDWKDRYDNRRDVKYDYADGRVSTRSWDPAKGTKKFTQNAGHTSGSALYTAGDVGEADTVWLVEGEADAGAIHMHTGGAAVSAAEGYNGIAKADLTPLAGKVVNVLADADEGGQKWLAAARDKLTTIACTVNIRTIPDGRKDATDILAAGLSLDGLPTVRTGPRALVTSLAGLIPESVDWLWDRRIPAGMITLLVGAPSGGKSTFGYQLIADLTVGTAVGKFHGQPQDVLIVATEDTLLHVIVPRLVAAGADLARVHPIQVEPVEGEPFELSFPKDIDRVREGMRDTGSTLLFLDPLMSRIDERIDAHRDGDVRRALEPLTALCGETGLTVVGIIHTNKMSGSDPLQRIMGSTAFAAVARSVLLVVRHPEQEGTRVLAHAKCNVGAEQISLTYTINQVFVPGATGPVETSRLQWTGETDMTGRDALAATQVEDVTDADDRNACRAWLSDWLESQGESTSADAQTAARKAGFSERAVRRAAKSLGVVYASRGYPRVTTWRLPPPQSGQSGPNTPSAVLTGLTDGVGPTVAPESADKTAGQTQLGQLGQLGTEFRSETSQATEGTVAVDQFGNPLCDGCRGSMYTSESIGRGLCGPCAHTIRPATRTAKGSAA